MPPLQQPSAIHFDNTGNLTFQQVDEINIYPCELVVRHTGCFGKAIMQGTPSAYRGQLRAQIGVFGATMPR
jgi:hypothetical protein